MTNGQRWASTNPDAVTNKANPNNTNLTSNGLPVTLAATATTNNIALPSPIDASHLLTGTNSRVNELGEMNTKNNGNLGNNIDQIDITSNAHVNVISNDDLDESVAK